jgi:hypothetical protein
LGTETIFIYAAPPVFLAVKRFWWLLLLLCLLGAMLGRYLWFPFTSISRLRRWIQGVHPTIKGVVSFFLLVLLAMALAPLIKHVAVDRADEKWDRVGVRIQASVAKPEERNTEYADYKSCAERRVLDMIFADKNVYYLLCISEINEAAGAVYEVRRTDSRLASVRPARRSLATKGGKR